MLNAKRIYCTERGGTVTIDGEQIKPVSAGNLIRVLIRKGS